MQSSSIESNQEQSIAIKCNQVQSSSIKFNQEQSSSIESNHVQPRPSSPIQCNQVQSSAIQCTIKCNQVQSSAIKATLHQVLVEFAELVAQHGADARLDAAGAEGDEVVLAVAGEGEGGFEVELALLVAAGRLEDTDALVCGEQQGEGDGSVVVDEGDDAGVVLDDGEEVSPPGESAASADMGGEIL